MITFATVSSITPAGASSISNDARYGDACTGDWLRARPQLAAFATLGHESAFGKGAFSAALTGVVAVADALRLLMTDVHIPTTAGLPAWSPPT